MIKIRMRIKKLFSFLFVVWKFLPRIVEFVEKVENGNWEKYGIKRKKIL
jgi:hypothetical protein